jgi:hypothetical protein
MVLNGEPPPIALGTQSYLTNTSTENTTQTSISPFDSKDAPRLLKDVPLFLRIFDDYDEEKKVEANSLVEAVGGPSIGSSMWSGIIVVVVIVVICDLNEYRIQLKRAARDVQTWMTDRRR